MTEVHTAAWRGFTEAAASYHRARPGYPPEIITWLQTQLALAPGKRALELGAGTGKFTQCLTLTGAQLDVIEPVLAMRAHLLENAPAARVVSGSAESIGLEDNTVDAVLCAQSFHWFATRAVLTEIRRVLKPGGALGLVWNLPDERVPWVAVLEGILRPLEAAAPYAFRRGTWREIFPDERFSQLECFEFQHVNTGTTQCVIVDRVRSLSYIANLPPAQQQEIIEKTKDVIRTHPALGGRRQIEFPYRTYAYHCQVAAP